MKLSQKAKYVGIGALAMTVAIPLILKATDAVPLTFSQGDILSAEVLNTLFGRLNDVQKGFEASTDIVGTWSCTSYSILSINCDAAWKPVGDDVRLSRSQNIEFTCTGATCTATATTFSPSSCEPGPYLLSTNYALTGSIFASQWSGLTQLRKLSPESFEWISGKSYSGDGRRQYTVCTKQSLVPTPPTGLSATVTGTSVALTWVDQSTNETGFKVQTKTTVTGTWITSQTTAADVLTATVVGTVGNNWYRVLATNANGDSIISNEILLEIK